MKIFSVLLLLFLHAPAYAALINGKVVTVIDGNTIEILTQDQQKRKVHFSGIDAPEPTQPHGQDSKNAIVKLLEGKDVSVIIREETAELLSGIVTLENADINLHLLKTGMAWCEKENPKKQALNEKIIYAVAQFNARYQRKGLWSAKSPTPPWEYREKSKESVRSN